MNKSDLLYSIIELIVLIIPIGGLIWKAAEQAGKIKFMDKRLNLLEERVAENEKKSAQDIKELKDSITNLDKKIDVNNERLYTSLQFITQTLTELKGMKNGTPANISN